MHLLYISYFSVTMIKHREQGNLWKEEFIWLTVAEGESIVAEEAWGQEVARAEG